MGYEQYHELWNKLGIDTQKITAGVEGAIKRHEEVFFARRFLAIKESLDDIKARSVQDTRITVKMKV